jgi:hypothetical protein
MLQLSGRVGQSSRGGALREPGVLDQDLSGVAGIEAVAGADIEGSSH